MHWHVFIRTKRPLNITTRNICNRIYTSPKPLRCKANITSYYWEQISDIDDLKELKLKPSERNVTFQFAALDYIDPQSISYAYRLKGLEENWNEVDNSRSASYINLPPGDYELQIRSTNSDGVFMPFYS